MLLIHTRTVNFINRVRVFLHALASLTNSAKGHVENSISHLVTDEQTIHDMDQCLTEFACDPFDLGNPTLRSLQSGQVVSEKLTKDFETAHADGENLVQEFLNQRMFSDTVPFNAAIHRNSRLNFSKQSQAKDSTPSISKTSAMENKAMAEVIALAENSQEKFAIMQYCVTDECLPIFNINGSLRK